MAAIVPGRRGAVVAQAKRVASLMRDRHRIAGQARVEIEVGAVVGIAPLVQVCDAAAAAVVGRVAETAGTSVAVADFPVPVGAQTRMPCSDVNQASNASS